ncbi:MAG: hypothetical protein N2Z22_10880 [Turneriella sp.]|nr:hypothetical protein [Leptospiraceae bacterium]MCX7633823.1 hypothetical protein [Turneriella sp.]
MALWRCAIAAFCLFGVIFCGGKKPAVENDPEAMLRRFFTVKSQAVGKPDGIWLADHQSVAAMVEKKFLADYVAKPDELQKEEIRKRLKSLVVLYRIEGPTIAMLSQVADSAGVSSGTLSLVKEQPKGIFHFQAVLRGKGNATTATLRYDSKEDRLEYSEAGFTIRASRERRSAQELASEFRQRLEATDLPRF